LSKELSVIVVNYNVSPFLKLCLYSVSKAIKSLDAEVFVVDNASSDGSVEMVSSCFPFVNLMVNDENVGFSAANNRAIREAEGKIILLLNPDTIISEDTFEKLIAFYEDHSDAAGVGAKMIDGTGKYLPESKRGIPSSRDFIFKYTGLIKIFPESDIISRYYMGHLSQHETWEVPVLAGAFMAFPDKAVEKIGLMDEEFFMYGEDIDYSYRLSTVGKNYFTPDLKIIHFKGESTVKDHNYINRFYGAMLIFSRKHFFPEYGKFRKFMVTTAINLVKTVLKFISSSKADEKTDKLNQVSADAFYVGGHDGFEKVKNSLGYAGVRFFDSFEDIDVVRKSDEVINLFIDIKTISIKDMISFMERYNGMFMFSFISPDRDFYLYSTGYNVQGKVVRL